MWRTAYIISYEGTCVPNFER